eukprot:11173345-Lingulodinium_polyedra.AAC.1
MRVAAPWENDRTQPSLRIKECLAKNANGHPQNILILRIGVRAFRGNEATHTARTLRKRRMQ